MDTMQYHLYKVLEAFADSIIIVMQILTILMVCYYLFLSAVGILRRSRGTLRRDPEKTFAVVVAAHNEEMVIGPLLENLKALEYPDELYDIYVVADNCTDHTAEIARAWGVTVHERQDQTNRGKGYALEWLFDRIFAQDKSYDAVVIFDADNLVKKDFLSVMNGRLLDGCRIVQGYLDAKNPYDTWVTNSFAISFWMGNRMMQLARHHMKLSSILSGTGMCISYPLLREMGWGAHSLSEDLEFTARALMRGVKTQWAHDAVVYDEKPLKFKQSWRQRKRWAQGHWDVAGTYIWPLFLKGIREKKWAYIDIAIDLCKPHIVLVSAVNFALTILDALLGEGVMTTTIVTNALPGYFWWVVIALILFVFPVLSFLRDKLPWRSYLGLLPWWYPVFMYAWIPILVAGFVHRDRREWSHTEHSRSLNYGDIVQEESV